MFSLLMLVVGVTVGWMVPQPIWAKPYTDKIKAFLDEKLK